MRTAPFSLDTALVVDLFDYAGLDRVWWHAWGGWRIADTAMLAFRGTVDIIGARPLLPRDVYLGFSWRELGPFSFSASYLKLNTVATALSYEQFFRPLEDPNKTFAQKNPFAANSDAPTLYSTNLNNAQLFLVDRDRVRLEAAFGLGPSLEVYGDVLGERRGDVAYAAGTPIGQAILGIRQSVEAFFGGPCAYDPDAPYAPRGSNPSVPVYADFCRFGGSLGLRDPFLAGVGSFDLRATFLDGYFQSTRRLSLRVGAALGTSLWVEAGGALENHHNHRVFVSYDPSAANGTPHFLARATNAYLLDGTLSWRVLEGLIVEASYFGFLEDVPLQGDTLHQLTGYPLPRDTSQYTQTLYARTLYRF